MSISDTIGGDPGDDAGQLHGSFSSASEVVHELSCAIQSLEDYGLLLAAPEATPADAVEQVLITDAWSCDQCGDSKLPLCPLTDKPHRRRLVRVAQSVLQLVGRRMGRAYAKPARLTERIGGHVRVRTERHMAMDPHLLLLAFYFAADTGTGAALTDDPAPSDQRASLIVSLLPECARHLIDLLRQLQLYGKRVPCEVDERYAQTLLKSFYAAWRQYLKLAGSEVQQARPHTAERLSADELFNGTRSALFAAVRESTRDPADTSLKAFAALLYQRVQRLATKEQLQLVQEELNVIERPQLRQPVVASSLVGDATSDVCAESTDADVPLAAVPQVTETPKIESASPTLLPSDLNTSSGSDGDALPPAAAARAIGDIDGKPVLGPELPPDWYVDEMGKSRPKPGFEDRKRRERFLQLEFRARKSYESVMNVEAKKTPDEQLMEAVNRAVGDAQLAELARQLNLPSPKFTLLRPLLQLAQRSLVDALPRRFRAQLEQQFRDVLDWSVMRRRAESEPGVLSNVLRFVMRKVILYGAPEREAVLRASSAKAEQDLDQRTPDLGTAVANAFRTLFAAIKDLRADVAKYTLLLVSSELRGNATTYIRSFLSTCLPPATAWKSSLAFLDSHVDDVCVREWAGSSQSECVTSLTMPERIVRGCVLFGLVDLLRSGSHTTADRWDQLPAEIFYFEKPLVFEAANTVQQCTLLLLLEGTVSMSLTGKGCTHAQVATILRALHTRVSALLKEEVQLSLLKDDVSSFLDGALEQLSRTGDGAGTATAAAFPPLSPTERDVIGRTIDKMTDTQNPLYSTFEKRVLQYFTLLLRGEVDVPPLGLVTESAKQSAAALHNMLVFNWEVYHPYYSKMISLLHFDR